MTHGASVSAVITTGSTATSCMVARTEMRSFPERMGMAGVGMGPERRSPVSAHSLLGSRKFLINEEVE